jgi:hypothetical protein
MGRNRRRSQRANPSSTSTHQHESKVLRAVIQEVNPVKWTCTVIPVQGGIPLYDVPISPTSLGPNGQGSFHMPEVNTPVWICRPSDESSYFIMGGATMPTQTDSSNDDEDPTDRRMNRLVPGEGDQVLSGEGGSPLIILRKTGVLEIGASQMCMTQYINLKDTIEEFFVNRIMHAAGGQMSWESRTDDDSHGSGKDPVELRLQIKEFTDEAPMIDIGFGRIKEEDSNSIPWGSVGEIIGRVLINDTFSIWVDKRGNLHRVHKEGGEFVTIGGRKHQHVEGNFSEVVRGVMNSDFGSRKTVVRSNDVQSIGGDQEITIGGNRSETVTGVSTNNYKQVSEEVSGSFTRKAGGTHKITASNIVEVAAGDHHVGARNSKEAYAGKKEIIVGNVNQPLGEDVGYQVNVNLGDLELYTRTGTVRISAGPIRSAPTSEFEITPSGVLKMTSTYGAAEVEVNSSGIRIKTVAGEISIDNLGTVSMGPTAGVPGSVITTSTYPVDFVTGAPIPGALGVTAKGIPTPSAFLPSGVVGS